MKGKQLEGIILYSRTLFEKDKLIELMTESHGRVQILVKRAHSTKNKIGGRIEPLNVTRFWVTKGRSFLYMTQCDLITSFTSIRTRLDRLNCAFYFFDIIRKATSINQPNDMLYKLLYKGLLLIHEGKDLLVIKHFFQYHFLKEEGLIQAEDKHITDQEFMRHFIEYTQQKITMPIFSKEVKSYVT